MRTTLLDVRLSRLPALIGLCQDNRQAIAAAVNEAQQRLIMSFGEVGAWAGWEKVVFTASRANPYITLPSRYCRAINLAVCRHPFRVYNEFYSTIPAGPGLPPNPASSLDWCGEVQGFDLGMVPTLVDLPSTSILRVYASDPADVASAKRIFISGLDQNGQQIFSQDRFSNVNGFYITLDTPFADTTFSVSKIQAVSKDITLGNIILKSVSSTGVETTLSTYGPYETNPAYRRYQITSLPSTCCPTSCPPQTSTNVQITAICKLEYVPAVLDSDFLIINNIPALIEECVSIRMSEMDDPRSMAKSEYHHKRAIRQLNNQARHYTGDQVPSVSVDIWDGQPLIDQNVGRML